MFIPTQFPRPVVSPLAPKRFAGLTAVDLEGVLLQVKTPTADLVDTETRQQIIQSLLLRMRQVGYVRRLPADKMSKKVWY